MLGNPLRTRGLMYGKAGKSSDMITFYEQAVGSSHQTSNKPCQDSGLAFSKDGVHIAIVCDGHGSDSYVRSEIGSRLAAEVACDKIIKFIKSGNTKLLIGKRGLVTAVPSRNPLKDKDGNLIRFDNLSETEQEIVLQNKSYVNSVEKEKEIEELFRNFFLSIVNAWKDEIHCHLKQNPFSPKEREKVGARSIEKAYGSTLMAAVWTSECWFAFHIGDGKLLLANELMEWSEPVPWDCNCFLNYTTSLCDNNPVGEFRYAYDGTGKFPIAFMLGSDGLDDTFIKDELLHLFYSQVLKLIGTEPKEQVRQLLRDSLSKLSEKGSHDDMSVAAIVNESALSTAIEYFDIMQQVRSLNKERSQKEADLAAEENKISSLINEIIQLMQNHKTSAEQSLAHYIQMLEAVQNEIDRLGDEHNTINDKVNILSSLMTGLQQMKETFDIWKQQGKEKIESLKSQAEQIKKTLANKKEVGSESSQEAPSPSVAGGIIDSPDTNESQQLETPPPFNKEHESLPREPTDNPKVEQQDVDISETQPQNSSQHTVDENEERRLDEQSIAQFAELNKENNNINNIK